jgi:hypothetical protein
MKRLKKIQHRLIRECQLARLRLRFAFAKSDREELKKKIITTRNLHILADYIEENVAQEFLEMTEFRLDEFGEECSFFSVVNCGSSGCALGWGPFAKGLEPLDSEIDKCGLSFINYSYRIFPALGRAYKNALWSVVFDANLSSEKSEVLRRLRDMAAYLSGGCDE